MDFSFQNFCSVEHEHIVVKEEPGYFVKREEGDQPQARKIVKKRQTKLVGCCECFENKNKVADLLLELESLRSKEQDLKKANEELRAKSEEIHSALQSKLNNASSELVSLRSVCRDAQLKCERLQSQGNKKLNTDCAEYAIEEVIGHKKVKGKWRFKVHWQGYDVEESTWESQENLKHILIFKEYLKKYNLK